MKKTITLICWNVNGIRATLKKGFLDFMKKYDPDIVCLQETKAERNQVEVDFPDYQEYWNSAVKKGYSGTAIFSKEQPLSVHFGFLPSVYDKKELLDDQGRNVLSEGRVITAEYNDFYVVNQYRPNAKDDLSRLDFIYKKWDPLFLKHCKELEKTKPVILCGDLNVAHKEIDLARPKENQGVKGFTKEEREGFDNLVDAGFVDTLRVFHPGEPGHYTWWSPWAKARERNVGWRIDYVCVSKSLEKKLVDAYILPEVIGSDHCPVAIKIEV